ncbi:MAG: hypothetical protein JZU63_10890, partial [Rhodoferax sp.]|nr:hypothetical protein [Rhodoferax sp.]
VGDGVDPALFDASIEGATTRIYLGGDPSLAGSWNGGTLPTLFDKVTVNHAVSGNVIAWDITNTSGTITLKDGALNRAVNSLTIAKAGTGSDAVNLGTATLNFDPSGYLHSSSGRLNLPNAPTLTMGGVPYTVINRLGTATDNSADGHNTLQGIGYAGGSNARLAAKYVLGLDIDASATAGWNSGSGGFLGFKPIGYDNGQITGFTGALDGLGHSIHHLTINRPTDYPIGLFGTTDN